VQLWPVVAGGAARQLPWQGSLICVAWSPDDKVIACGSQDCSVHFWRLDDGDDSEMTGYPLKPKTLAWDARGALLATGGDLAITVWDFAGNGPEGTRPIQLEAHRGALTQLTFHPNRALLASAAQDCGVMLWEPRKRTTPVAYALLHDTVTGLSWDRAGARLAASDATGQIATWQAPS
jgi:WD40 repeat protein